MRLITLNIWGGHVKEPLLRFIESRQEIDFFCLQEVYHRASESVADEERTVHLDIFSEMHALLPNHTAFFKPAVKCGYGIGIFARKGLEVVDEGEIVIHHNPQYSGKGPLHSRILQWLKYRNRNQTCSIMNVHGLWNGQGKVDSQDRLNQSKAIRSFLDATQGPVVLCGDFNLRPDTESMRMIEEGMVNLVKAHQVTDTRTSFYPKAERFADYILVRPEIGVKTFRVLPDEVSDHAALFLEFE